MRESYSTSNEGNEFIEVFLEIPSYFCIMGKIRNHLRSTRNRIEERAARQRKQIDRISNDLKKFFKSLGDQKFPTESSMLGET